MAVVKRVSLFKMRIVCLQFNPELRKVEHNMQTARRLLEEAIQELHHAGQLSDNRSTWLLLPEMAFSGYNFADLTDIKPYLEPTKAGPSTQWAKDVATQYKWFVTVGYPEVATGAKGLPVYFNSTVTVAPDGTVATHYRKSFLYYTDQTWASEGEVGDTPNGIKAGFRTTEIDSVGRVSMGICMDINPYQFLSPFEAYEFANHVLKTKSEFAIVNMAWMTTLTPEELMYDISQPDTRQYHYWIQRFLPLIEATANNSEQKFIVACANRCGVEGSSAYAGSSCVMRIKGGKIEVFSILGKMEQKCLIVDTEKVQFVSEHKTLFDVTVTAELIQLLCSHQNSS